MRPTQRVYRLPAASGASPWLHWIREVGARVSHTVGEIREHVWTAIMRARAGAYPLPVHGHHPNFRGAATAAERLDEHLGAHFPPGVTALSFPDYVLRPVRRRLLERGVHLVVPAKYGSGYRLLESGAVPAARASSIAGAERYGAALERLPPVQLAVIACVALTRGGAYLRKGYGFRLPPLPSGTLCATIVHPLQIVPDIAEPDGRLAVYATAEEVVLVGK